MRERGNGAPLADEPPAGLGRVHPSLSQRTAVDGEAWEFHGNTRFEVRRRLGAGSFGAVFEVFDSTRNARVALKLLRAVVADDLYRFKQEFRTLAGFAHPNLVELYELLGEDDRWFFTMELVQGGGLLAFVRRTDEPAHAPTLDAAPLARARREARSAASSPIIARQPAGFDELRVRSVLVQLVEGLAALHDAGKLHRDIKPSNVLVTAEGRLVLVDFGLAVRLSSSAAHSRVALVGTPEYLAPELIEGAAASAASDWYGVGVLLYEALTGVLPFAGSLAEVLGRKIARDPPPPSALTLGVPPDLDELCASLLSRDPAARPGGAALLARLGGVPSAVRREVPFVGRAAERAALAGLYGAVEAQRGAAVALVDGPSGIGKSALLDQLCRDLRRRAPRVLVLGARCYEQESVPYKALDGLVDPLSRYLQQLHPRAVEAIVPADFAALAWLFPVLQQVEAIGASPGLPLAPEDPQERRRRGSRALRELLVNLAERWPVVVVIDDLQWGDEDSALLLLDLLGGAWPPRLFLVAAYRSEEAETSACLRTLLRGLEARRGPSLQIGSITLGALGEPETRALARSLLDEARAGDDALLAAISREARGRPFLVRELCDVPVRRAASTGPAAEISVEALIRARVAALPEGPRRLLELLSVAGRPVDRAAAMRAAELGDAGPSAYVVLRNARFVRSRDAGGPPGEGELEPYHDRIREAVASGLGAERRADCSRRLAAALEGTRCTDPETLAVYHFEGGDPTRAAALMQEAAAAAARSLAFDGAARLHRRTLELLPEADAGVTAVQERLGEALANAGRGAEAAVALVAASEGAPPDRAFELRRRAAEQLLAAGHVDEGLARLRACLAEASVRVPDRAWVVTLGTAILFVWLAVRGLGRRPRRADEIPAATRRRIDACESAARVLNGVAAPLGAYFAVRTTLLALAAGEPVRLFNALILFSVYGAALRGRSAATVTRALTLAGEIGAELGLPDAAARHRLGRGAAALLQGNLRAARAELTPVVEELRRLPTGRSWAMNTAHEFWFSVLVWSGAWKELSEQLPEVLDDARRRGSHGLVRSLSLRFAHTLRLLEGDVEGARQVHAAAREGWWPPRYGLWDSVSMHNRADIHLYAERGRGPSAHRLVEEIWPSLARSGLMGIRIAETYLLHTRDRAALAFAASEGVRDDEREAALVIVADGARRLAVLDTPTSRALGRLAEAGLASARGGDEEAAAAWARAEEALDAAECRHFAAAAKRRRGALLGGKKGEALIGEADAWLEAQGAREPARLARMFAPG